MYYVKKQSRKMQDVLWKIIGSLNLTFKHCLTASTLTPLYQYVLCIITAVSSDPRLSLGDSDSLSVQSFMGSQLGLSHRLSLHLMDLTGVSGSCCSRSSDSWSDGFTPRTCSTLAGGECPLINHFNIWGSDSTLLTNQALMFCTHQHIWGCRNAQ